MCGAGSDCVGDLVDVEEARAGDVRGDEIRAAGIAPVGRHEPAAVDDRQVGSRRDCSASQSVETRSSIALLARIAAAVRC